MSTTIQALQDSLERIVVDPKYHAALVLVKAIRNGAVYGAKVRFPHALVMIFLFRSGTVREKVRLVLHATRQHASNLARFAFVYKSGMLVLRGANRGKERGVHHFLSGLLGGYWVFGRKQNSINQQIVIYIFARVLLALAKLAVQPPGDNSLVGSSYGGRGGIAIFKLSPAQLEFVHKYSWPAFASLSWASVMWIFETHPETLQNSLKSSMYYIYRDCNTWDSLRTLVVHNK